MDIVVPLLFERSPAFNSTNTAVLAPRTFVKVLSPSIWYASLIYLTLPRSAEEHDDGKDDQ